MKIMTNKYSSNILNSNSSCHFSPSTIPTQQQFPSKEHRNSQLNNMFKVSSKVNQINSTPNQLLKNNQSIQSFVSVQQEPNIKNQNTTINHINIQFDEKQFINKNNETKITCQSKNQILKYSINENNVQLMKLSIQNIQLQNNNKRLALIINKLTLQNKLLKNQIQKLLQFQGSKDNYEFNSKLHLYCKNQKILELKNNQGRIETQATINCQHILNEEEENCITQKHQAQKIEKQNFQQKYYTAEKYLFDARQQIKRLVKQIQYLKMKGLKDIEHQRKIKNEQCLFLQKKFKKLLDDHIEVIKTTRRLQLAERLKNAQQEKYKNINQHIKQDGNSLFQLSSDHSFLP